MLDGDIDNRAAPRVVFVWEGLIAQLPADRGPVEAKFVRRRKWSRALDLWEENEAVRHAVVDITWRSDVSVDLLCIHPRGFAELLRRRLDDDGYPYGHLYNMSLMAFDKELAFLPNVQTVFHSFIRMPFLFGGRGRLVRSTDRVAL